MGRRAYSPKEIAQLRIKELPLEGKWAEAFGRPSLYETWFVTGQSASGKSSFVMQLSKMLCGIGPVLYVSLEEGVSLSFKQRMAREHMEEVQGRFRVVVDETMESLRERLKKPKSARFVVIDSFQYAGWDYASTKAFVESFPRKSFIFVSQEDKGRPLGKAAVRLKYMAGVKIRTIGFRAYCQGRFAGTEAPYYVIWPEKEAEVWLNSGNKNSTNEK